MTIEDKELLIKDLCVRLPYGIVVNAQYKDGEGWKTEDRSLKGVYSDGEVYLNCVYTTIDNIKPYLRSMSSITKEELNELKQFVCPDSIDLFDNKYLVCPTGNNYGAKISYQFMDSILTWLRLHHFDYNGLIKKGLALEAPEGMYK